MWLHKIDPSFKRISSCHKRLTYFAKEGNLNKTHPLWIRVSNALLFNTGWPEAYTLSERLVWLDWFSHILNDYMDNNRIDGNDEARTILHHCLQYDFDLYVWEYLVKDCENKEKLRCQ